MAAVRGFQLLDSVSVASGALNEDRIGQASGMAWVIDGATDVAAERLLPGVSDAAWLAEALDAELRIRVHHGLSLDALLVAAGETIAQRFDREQRRPPRERHELPSAAGIVLRRTSEGVELLSLGDCSLVVAPAEGDAYVAGDAAGLSPGDRRTGEAMRQIQQSTGTRTWVEARGHLLPRLRASREGLNRPGGYGAFSVVPVPAELVGIERIPLTPGTHLLLASDGFMRLADVYRRYRGPQLLGEGRRRGLAAIVTEMRVLEAADPECLAIPRAKPRDDASAMLLAVE